MWLHETTGHLHHYLRLAHHARRAAFSMATNPSVLSAAPLPPLILMLLIGSSLLSSPSTGNRG
jgi:hypothetical protein